MCLNHPELVHKHPTHIAISVMVRRFDEVCSICLNHPELVHKPPTHLASFVLVWAEHG